jgi:hypothetical protein
MHKKPRNRVFGPLISVLAVIFGLVLVGPISPANADSGECDVSGGYVKFDSGSGSKTLSWGTLNWSGTDINYTVAEGYSIGLCVKAGTAVDTTTVNGPASGTFQTPPTGPQGQRQGISHIGYKILESPVPLDATAAVDITPATCDTGETATPGALSHASWDSTDATEGPAPYSYVATADADHLFPAGDGVSDDGTTKTFEGDLAGPLTGQQCAEQPDPTTETFPHAEQSCELGGVHTWDVVYTTTYSWDEEAGEYVGTEDAGVVENDVFTEYTAEEAEELGCIEVEGEQGHGGHHHGTKHDPEVKGEQATVPSEVEAGLAGQSPAGGSSLPLWALTLGAGLFLTAAGRLRRNHR